MVKRLEMELSGSHEPRGKIEAGDAGETGEAACAEEE